MLLKTLGMFGRYWPVKKRMPWEGEVAGFFTLGYFRNSFGSESGGRRKPLCKLPLPCRFVEQDARSHASVERLDLRGVWNGDQFVDLRHQIPRKARALVSNEHCQRPGESCFMNGCPFMRRGCDESYILVTKLTQVIYLGYGLLGEDKGHREDGSISRSNDLRVKRSDSAI